MPEPEGREVVVAGLHLADDPLQGLGRLLRVGDDRRHQVRDALVDAQLDPLGVDQDHLHLVGRGAHQNGRDQPIEADAFAATCSTGHQHMRHLRQVGHDRLALDVLAEPDDHRVMVGHRGVRAEDVAEADDLFVGVGDLHADRALAWDHGEDADIGGFNGIGDVLRESGDPLHLDAGVKLDLVPGDCRAAGEADNRGLHLEVVEHVLQVGHDLVVGLRPFLVRGTLAQHSGRWKRVAIGVVRVERQLLTRQDWGRQDRARRGRGGGRRGKGRRGGLGLRGMPRLGRERLKGLGPGRLRRAGRETQVLEEVLADPGLWQPRRRTARPRVVQQDLRVIRLALVAWLDSALEPDRAAADLAAARSALYFVVFLVVLLGVPVVGRVAEQHPELSQSPRHLAHRRARDEEEAIGGYQAEQRRRHPGGEPPVERPGSHHPDEAAGGPHRWPAAVVRRKRRHALRDVEQAEGAGHQEDPADLRRRAYLMPFGVAHEPPADQREHDRDDERALAEDGAGAGVDAFQRHVVHMNPDRRREDDGEPQEGKPEPVALVHRVQVVRVAANVPHNVA